MIILDTETSGVDPNKHSIISIGCIEFENPENEFYGECSVWEGAHIEEEALEINGFTRKDITDPSKQSLEILMRGFLDWSNLIKERTLAGHNIGVFDIPFLKSSAERYSLNWNFAHRAIDTHSLTYMHMVRAGKVPPTHNKRTAINSSFVQSYVGIPEEPKPHSALNGAKVAGEAISRLLYGRSLLKEFEKFPVNI